MLCNGVESGRTRNDAGRGDQDLSEEDLKADELLAYTAPEEATHVGQSYHSVSTRLTGYGVVLWLTVAFWMAVPEITKGHSSIYLEPSC